MGIFSKNESQKLFVTASSIPSGFASIDFITASGVRTSADKAIKAAKEQLIKEAASVNADGIANVQISMVSESISTTTAVLYGDAIKRQ